MFGEVIFAKGANWRHKNLGHVVFIREVIGDDRFLLGFADSNDMFERNWHLPQNYTAEELIREFDPIFPETCWTLLLEDNF
jgi:hypothetical protein